jgi:hypothetical protein
VLVVRYVAWWNTQSNVFVRIVRAQRIEQTKSDDAPSLNLCRCHDVLPLLQQGGANYSATGARRFVVLFVTQRDSLGSARVTRAFQTAGTASRLLLEVDE